MAGSIFKRILSGLSAVGGSGGGGLADSGGGGRRSGKFPTAKVIGHFRDLDKVDRALPAAVVRYVADGGNPSVILTLQQSRAQQAWSGRMRLWPQRDAEALFSDLGRWQADQMQRFGEALAALEPLRQDWGYFGTKKSPDWLRHVVTIWLGQGRKNQPIAVLVDLAALSGDAIGPVLDIIFTRDAANYGVTNSVARFAGLSEWLDDARETIIAAAPTLAAGVRAELATAFGRLGLQESYRELLIDLACGSSKKVRADARQALTACDTAALTEALAARFDKAAPGTRAELVTIATGALGKAAPPLLARWRESETAPKVMAALDQAVGAITAPPAQQANTNAPSGPRSAVTARADGPDGYTAVDGSWVDAGGTLELPPPTKVPPELLASLEPAVEAFNKLLAKGKAEAVWTRWHWSKQYSSKDKGTLAALGRLGEGTTPLVAKSYGPAVDWLQFHQFKHPAVDAFFNDPRLTLRQLTRIGVAMSNCQIYGLLGDWAGPVGRAVQARLTDPPAVVRAFVAMWIEAGGSDFIGGFLQSRWTWGGSLPDFGTPMWPTLCTRFDDLDQALGMVPQSTAEPKLPQRGLELLALFPILPNRYRNRMMVLAGDSAAQTRGSARALLKDTPGIDGAIAVQLLDGKQEVRALAAEWLASRGAAAELPAIRQALKKEKSDVARAAMITALKRLGDDVSHLFDPAVLVKEATTGLAKTKPKGLDLFPFEMLPALRWADGTPVDPILPRWWITLAAKLKQPGGNALINLWLDRLAPGDAHKLGWMVLTGWIDEDTRRPSDAEANAYAAANVDAVLKANIANVKRWPQSADYFLTDRTALFAQLKRQKASVYLGTATESKGILALAARVNGADAAQRIRPFLKDHGSRTSQAKALLDVLAAIGSSTALQALLGAANRMKQRSVQDYAGKLVDDIAARNGWTAAQLADRTVPTAGFDPGGTQELDLGLDRTYRLQFDASDAIIIVNPDGREVKALPAARVEEEKPLVNAAKKQLSNARKEAKQVFASQTVRLQEAMFLQRAWDVAEWETFLAGHPLLGRIAARLVWERLASEGQSLGCLRPLGDGSYTDADDGDVTLADVTSIRLAHSSLLAPQDVTAWRQHLADYAVTAPFEQLGRDLPLLDVAQAKTTEIKDREGWMIETFKLRGAASKLGYQRGAAQDGGWFYTYEKMFRDAGVVVEIEFTGSPLPEVNEPAALISLAFRKLRGTTAGGQMALADVPPVLLAESWRDLHDIADKGTGLDPQWKKKANHGY